MMFSLKLSKKIIFSFLFLFLINGLFGESFRVKQAHIVQTETDISSAAKIVKIGTNEAIGVYLPEDSTFVNGLEVKFEIPEAIASWRDSIACSIYSSISPKPAANKIDYSGTRAYVQTLPGRLSWILEIPFSEETVFKANQYTTISDVISEIKDGVIFIRLQPVMKGIPEEAANAKITAYIKPLFINKGKVELNLSSDGDEMKPCSIFIDDEPLVDENNSSYSNFNAFLDTGIHNISIISEFYRNEVRTIRIDKARKTIIDVKMKSVEPTIFLTAPEGASIFLDDEPFTRTGEELAISEGEHQIRLILGDYEVVKAIQILKGRTYKINLSVDLQITEE